MPRYHAPRGQVIRTVNADGEQVEVKFGTAPVDVLDPVVALRLEEVVADPRSPKVRHAKPTKED